MLRINISNSYPVRKLISKTEEPFLKISRKLPLTVRNNFVAGSFPKSKIY